MRRQKDSGITPFIGFLTKFFYWHYKNTIINEIKVHAYIHNAGSTIFIYETVNKLIPFMVQQAFIT